MVYQRKSRRKAHKRRKKRQTTAYRALKAARRAMTFAKHGAPAMQTLTYLTGYSLSCAENQCTYDYYTIANRNRINDLFQQNKRRTEKEDAVTGIGTGVMEVVDVTFEDVITSEQQVVLKNAWLTLQVRNNGLMPCYIQAAWFGCIDDTTATLTNAWSAQLDDNRDEGLMPAHQNVLFNWNTYNPTFAKFWKKNATKTYYLDPGDSVSIKASISNKYITRDQYTNASATGMVNVTGAIGLRIQGVVGATSVGDPAGYADAAVSVVKTEVNRGYLRNQTSVPWTHQQAQDLGTTSTVVVAHDPAKETDPALDD